MAMVSLGLFELLILIASSSGGPNHDLVALIPAADYFKARNIKLDAATMLELAGKDPADGKTQLQQLVALRWLRDNPDEARKMRATRNVLDAIAAGKMGQDPQRFAQTYARQVLARLDGKPLPVEPSPEGSVSKDALAWFPAEFQFAVGIEMRPGGKTWEGEKETAAELVRELLPRMPVRERERVYEVAEAIGNVRLDRLAFGLEFDDNGRMKRAVVRITGAGDRRRLIEALSKTNPGNPEPKESKGPKGEPITTLYKEGHGPAVAFVGANELIWGGYDKDKGNHLEVIDAVLAVRAGKAKSMVNGPLADEMKLVPDNARAALAVTLTDVMRQELSRGESPFKAAPQKVLVYAIRGASLSLAALAAMKDAAEAKAFAEALDGLRKQGIKALEKPPPGANIPKEIVGMLKETLSGITFEVQGDTVKARAVLPSEKVLGEAIKQLLGAHVLDIPER
jgi:hypothetical protein